MEKVMLLEREKIYQGSLILVNQKYPIRHPVLREELFSVFSSQPEILMEQESAAILKKLLQEVLKEQGAKQDAIVGVSGYRPKEEQIAIFEESFKENGKEFTEKYVAFPDHSEHQTGLAIDLAENKPEIDFIRPEFPYNGICQRFREKSASYGFIERYKQEKQEITGIGAEPWHFRYVGIPHAEIMQKRGFSLEEYIEWLKQFDFPKHPLSLEINGQTIQIGYVKAQEENTEILLPETLSFDTKNQKIKISGNNVDGFIITILHNRQ